MLADCGIGLGENGGSTSREMIYYPGDVWTDKGLDTNRPTMMVNIPWTGSYPWGQHGGVTATMPNGDVFTVHIDASVKDPNPAGDAWHKYEMDIPLKCYSYHWDRVYQLDDGKWCSSAYVCNHLGIAYIKPDDSANNDTNADGVDPNNVRCDDPIINNASAQSMDQWAAAGADRAYSTIATEWLMKQNSTDPTVLSFSEYISDIFSARHLLVCSNTGNELCDNMIYCSDVNQPAGYVL